MKYEVHAHTPDGEILDMTHENPTQGLKDLLTLILDKDHLETLELVHIDGSTMHVTRNRHHPEITA